jgi:hypothetical protein
MTDSGESLPQRSVLHSVDLDFRAVICAGGNGQEEALCFSFWGGKGARYIEGLLEGN